MKLVRNTTEDGSGKYMLLLTRKLDLYRPTASAFEPSPVLDAVKLLLDEGVVDDSVPESEGEFFVIRLRDKYARAALLAYSQAAYDDDPEYADEVTELANRAGPNSPFMKRPD
jgi:hypothetical protein